MQPTLIALHGYTMNGARLRALGQELFRVLEQRVTLVFADAPHVCPPEAAEAAFSAWGMAPPEPPYLRWWRASDDRQTYEGWEASCASVRALIPEQSPVGILGFSQGAMLAACLSALSACGRFPALQCAVLIAGGVPRANDLRPLFDEPIALPSLHLWGARDPIANNSAPRLAECFQEAQRETVNWPGSHSIPQSGLAASTIARFVRERLGVFEGS
jgi:predicted esterase